MENVRMNDGPTCEKVPVFKNLLKNLEEVSMGLRRRSEVINKSVRAIGVPCEIKEEPRSEEARKTDGPSDIVGILNMAICHLQETESKLAACEKNLRDLVG